MLLALKKSLLRRLHENRRNPVCRRIGSLARTILYAYEHPGYDLATNGEEGVLRTLRGAGLRLALDVGANRGEWTRLLLRHHPSAQVHLFEVAPPTHATLVRELASVPGVTIHPHGLGARDETIEFRYYPSQDGLTTSTLTMHDRPHDLFSGRILRGEAWAAAAGLTAADILKIDVEGMEIDVLRGFGPLVSGGAIRFIQFEHHFGRAILHDFHALLGSAGYVLGKIYSDHVAFAPYDMSMEDGIGPNYLAVRADQREWIDRLSRGWKNSPA